MPSATVREYVFVGLVAALIAAAAVFATQLARRDWQYFVLEKQLQQWQVDSPPSLAELISISQIISSSGNTNPNFLRLNAWVLEWRALVDSGSQRFYLYGAEEALEQSLRLRPTDSRAWAHLAVVKNKLFRDQGGVNNAANKAIMLGSGDQQTNQVLSKLDPN